MNLLKIQIAKKFPGLVFPTKAPVRPGELIGYLSSLLQLDPACVTAAEEHLPKKEDQH